MDSSVVRAAIKEAFRANPACSAPFLLRHIERQCALHDAPMPPGLFRTARDGSSREGVPSRRAFRTSPVPSTPPS